jgi:VanZ family protein
MSRKAKIVAKLLPIIAWMLVIFLMSSEVSTDSTARSDEIVRTIKSIGVSAPADLLTFLVRKAAHISAYFVLGVLIYNLLKEYHLRIKHLVLASIALAMLYACTDELHQMFVPGRSGEIRDVLIDTAGAAAGVGMYATVAMKLYKKPELV